MRVGVSLDLTPRSADVAELVDAPDLDSGGPL
jgi:hypothetical protein